MTGRLEPEYANNFNHPLKVLFMQESQNLYEYPLIGLLNGIAKKVYNYSSLLDRNVHISLEFINQTSKKEWRGQFEPTR